MNYLTPHQVLAIHDQMVKRFGGSQGVRDITLIESAVARAQVTYDGKDLYETVFDKAASLLKLIIKDHPFVGENKRTALTSAVIYLKLNRFVLTNSHEEEIEFAVCVDNQNLSIEEIAKWLKAHVK